MSDVYKVRVNSGSGQDRSTVLQVVADSPDEAAEAVRAKVARDTLVEADTEPLSAADAERASFISDRILLS